jgi:hypothetical protein
VHIVRRITRRRDWKLKSAVCGVLADGDVNARMGWRVVPSWVVCGGGTGSAMCWVSTRGCRREKKRLLGTVRIRMRFWTDVVVKVCSVPRLRGCGSVHARVGDRHCSSSFHMQPNINLTILYPTLRHQLITQDSTAAPNHHTTTIRDNPASRETTNGCDSTVKAWHRGREKQTHD